MYGTLNVPRSSLNYASATVYNLINKIKILLAIFLIDWINGEEFRLSSTALGEHNSL